MKKYVTLLLIALVLVTTQGCSTSKKTDGSGQDAASETKKPASQKTLPEIDTENPIPSELKVKKIKGIKQDFMRGVDISSVAVEYDSGVCYYDFDGNKLPLEPKDGE